MFHKAMRLVLVSAVLLPLAVPLSIAYALEDSSPDALLESLRSAWRARTRKFDSVKFEWDASCEYYQGSLDLPPTETESVKKDGAKQEWPKKVEFPRVLMLRGKWMKHVSRTVGASRGGASLAQSDYVSGFDGESSRLLFSNTQEVTGSIRDEQRNRDSSSDSLRPLMYFVRPFDTEVGMVDPASLRVVDQEGNDGLLVVQANAKRRFVVDPERGFLILNWEQGNPALGGHLKEGRIEYQRHEQLGWIPARWQLDCFSPSDPSKLLRRHAAVVTHVEAGVEYDQSAFRVEFPVGAQIYDHHTSEEYVIKEDGSKRDVSLFKRQDAPLAVPKQRSNVLFYLIIANVVVLVALGLAVGISQFRKRTPD